jgi:methyl-accepting chemotaxis protein
MDVDQRLERLVERHEALAQSVEMLKDSIQEQSRNIDKVLAAAERDGENIRALARIAEIHEQRISDLEGGDTA